MYKLLPLILLATSLSYASNPVPTDQSVITVYAAGDIADCRNKKSAARSAATAALIEAGIAQDPGAIVLALGDHTYPVGTPAEFETCYHPTWGKFKNRTYPTPGNHEYYSPNGYAYFQYFGDAAGSQKQSYYSFNVGSWHIISLNSNFKKEPQRQEQLAWLAQDLKNNRSACTLAFWHHPTYSSGFRGNYSAMDPAWKMLIAAKADLVLSAHEHYYERFAPQNAQGEKDDQTGMREFIVGTGGANLTYAFWQKANSEVLNKKVHGVLKLTLEKQSYAWQFMPIEGSSFMDEGSAACHAK